MSYEDEEQKKLEEEYVRECIRIYKDYYPDDLKYWAENQLKAILNRTVEFYITANVDLTEEDVQNYLMQCRRWLFRAKPNIKPIEDRSILRNENPIEQPKDPDEASVHPDVQKYKAWLSRLYNKFSKEETSHWKIVLTKDPYTNNEITRIEWPEREELVGEWNWDTLQGKVYPVRHMGPSDWESHTLEDSKMHWKMKVKEIWGTKIPASKIQFTLDEKINMIIAETPPTANGKHQIGWFSIPKREGVVRAIDSDDPEDYIYVDESVGAPLQEADIDPDTEKLNIWKQSVLSRYPNLKDRIRFVSKDQGKHVSAEIPGMDRSFGVFDMDTMTGHVLGESKGVTKKVFEGFISELNNIAGIYK